MRLGWINIFGLIIVVLMFIPNIIYACQKKHIKNKCANKVLNILEQIGKYGSMILMVFNIGMEKFGFWSEDGFAIWVMGIPLLIFLYWIVWFMYFKNPKKLYLSYPRHGSNPQCA